jgi:hypothetical protein
MQTKYQIADREFMPPMPEGLAYDTLDGITRHGAGGVALGDDETQSGARFRTLGGWFDFAWRGHNEQRPSGKTFTLKGGRIFRGAV